MPEKQKESAPDREKLRLQISHASNDNREKDLDEQKSLLCFIPASRNVFAAIKNSRDIIISSRKRR